MPSPPLIGRQDELAHLEGRLADAIRGVGGTVDLLAPPGTGGTRLLAELRRIAARRTTRYRWHQVRAGGSDVPYASLAALLQSTNTPLEALLSATQGYPDPFVPTVMATRITAAAPSELQVLALCDADRADPETRAVLDALAPHLPTTRTLLVRTWSATPTGGDVLALAPLTLEQAAALARALTGTDVDRSTLELAAGRPGDLVALLRSPAPATTLRSRMLALGPQAARRVRLIALADGWWPDLPHADLAAAGITRAAPDRPGPLLTHPRWLEAAVELDRPDGWQADVRALLSAAPDAVPPARAAALAAAAGDAERAADLWLTAARRARGEHAPLSEALALLASVEHRFDPATALTAAQRAFDTGMAAQALEVLDRVLARLPRDASAAALLVRCRARYYVGDVAGAETDLDAVLERWERAAAPVRCDAAVLQALRLAAADRAAAQQWARTAQEQAATPAQQGRAHAARALAIGIAGEVDQAMARFDTALALLEDAGEVADAGRAASNRIFVLWRAGLLEAMLRAIDDELRRLEQLGLAASAGSHLLPGRAAALWTLGRWEELAAFLAQVRPLAGGMAADAAALVRLVEVELTAARGEVAAARRTLAAVVPTGPEVAAERAAVALGLAELDDLPADEAVVQQGIAAATGDGFAQARIAVALLRLGQPVPPELHTATPTDPSPESAAVAVEARAWHGEAAWTDAALAWEAVANPYRAAWCRWRSGTLDDLATAQATAERLGAAPLADRVGRSLRNAGVRGARTAGPLTARELDVLALVARGLTNREVARALRMSDRTVGVHLGHIYTKLGAGTRAEAAHLARQQGLVD